MFDQAKYIIKYKNEHYSRVVLDVPKETKERWKAAAQKEKMPLATFVRQAVEERISRQES